MERAIQYSEPYIIHMGNEINDLIDRCVKRIMTYSNCGCHICYVNLWAYMEDTNVYSNMIWVYLSDALFPKIKGLKNFTEENVYKVFKKVVSQHTDWKNKEALKWLDEHLITYDGAQKYMEDLYTFLQRIRLSDRHFECLGLDKEIYTIFQIHRTPSEVILQFQKNDGGMYNHVFTPRVHDAFTKASVYNTFLKCLFFHYKDIGL